MVSIIIPNYNHESFLKQRIESILNQTFQEFEIIFLDDCSRDNSKEIIEQYKHHSKVSHVVYNEYNSGSTFKQWKKGIELAKGELIWIAESDDYASEYFLEELTFEFAHYKNVGVVYCNSFYVSDYMMQFTTTQEWKDSLFNVNRWAFNYVNSGINELNNYLVYHNIIDNVSCALFKRDLFYQIDLDIENFKYAGDWLIYLQMCQITNVAYLSKPLNFFRKHATNASRESDLNGMKYLEKLMLYSIINSKIRAITVKTKNKLLPIEVRTYLDFAYTTMKINRNLKLFIKGQIKLLKLDFYHWLRITWFVLFSSRLKRNTSTNY
ncbi:glycosyltransferase family 2 protein [Adhaeribacter pallidiroseus]|uniref:Putative glycosyltransferase n=1 Tax=Adhaeribacter pallidiroseus TaxID=2072847 RepID=A0A369QKE4_9BACT|nr:glycosyltransferase family 2 protein [Adhaeribacter pallidiroseus]RDC64115.1 putative glycosyltransferase [Adhaeribacter pallidiroseus]